MGFTCFTCGKLKSGEPAGMIEIELKSIDAPGVTSPIEGRHTRTVIVCDSCAQKVGNGESDLEPRIGSVEKLPSYRY